MIYSDSYTIRKIF